MLQFFLRYEYPPQRTMSEPARNASVLLAEALKPGASLDQITLALEAILAVTAKGLGGDASAYAQYQALLLELHVGSDPHTEPTRRWMASQVYLVEDRLLPGGRFQRRPGGGSARRSTPRSRRAAGCAIPCRSTCSRARRRSRTCASSWNIGSVPQLLQPPGGAGLPLRKHRGRPVFYRNLYGEAGAETPERSHPRCCPT